MTYSDEIQSIIDDVIAASELLGDHTTHANPTGCAFMLGSISARLDAIRDVLKLEHYGNGDL